MRHNAASIILSTHSASFNFLSMTNGLAQYPITYSDLPKIVCPLFHLQACSKCYKTFYCRNLQVFNGNTYILCYEKFILISIFNTTIIPTFYGKKSVIKIKYCSHSHGLRQNEQMKGTQILYDIKNLGTLLQQLSISLSILTHTHTHTHTHTQCVCALKMTRLIWFFRP